MEHASAERGKRFEMPDEETPKPVRVAAYKRLNGIAFTMEQIERIYSAGDRSARLKAAVDEGFNDPELALAASWLRIQDYLETRDAGGVDWATDDPDYYQSLATIPIDPGLFGLTEADVSDDPYQPPLLS